MYRESSQNVLASVVVVSGAKLTKYIRLVVYNFLDVKTTLKKISVLSKSERENLRDSGIARKGKDCELNLK